MSTQSCVVVDYGIGNVFSVVQGLKRLGAEPVLTGDHKLIESAERLVLPGVGAFGRAAERLRSLGLDSAIDGFIQTGRPFMGICVGMQLLMQKGLEFGEHDGLGYIDGTVEKIDLQTETGEPVRVPVIGWNVIEPETQGRWDGTPFERTDPKAAYYFVHSYSVRASNPADVCAVARVGAGSVVAAVQKDNIIGVQFHPERSADAGSSFLSAFMSL